MSGCTLSLSTNVVALSCPRSGQSRKGNGREDIVTANGKGFVTTLLINGDGTFRKSPSIGVAAAWFSVHVAFLLYMLTPLFFIVPPPPRRVAGGGVSDAAETTRL